MAAVASGTSGQCKDGDDELERERKLQVSLPQIPSRDLRSTSPLSSPRLEEALKQLYSNIEKEMGGVNRGKSEHSRESRENDAR